MPDIAGGLLLEELADLLDLCLAGNEVEQQVAQLARVGLHVYGGLVGARVALQHEDLVLGPTLLLDGLHCADGCGELPSSRAGGAGAGASSLPLTSHRGLGVLYSSRGCSRRKTWACALALDGS